MNNLEKIFDFLHEASKLKTTLRWTKLPNGRQESTAEHSWRLALMTFMIAEELKLDIDINHAVRIALVHDVAEAITGDYDSWKVEQGKFSKEDKKKLEREAMNKFRSILPAPLDQEIFDLWLEYEESQTPEAKYIKALDKIEFLSQFVESGYTIMDDGIDHTATYADKPVTNFPELKETLKVIKSRLKDEYKKGGWEWKKEYDEV